MRPSITNCFVTFWGVVGMMGWRQICGYSWSFWQSSIPLFLGNLNICRFPKWWSGESGSVTDWRWLFLHWTYFPWREQIGRVSCNIPQNSFVLPIMSIIWDVTEGLFVIICPATSCVSFLSACIHDLAHWKLNINLILFNCCIHIIVEPARFNKVGIFHCCVIEWSNNKNMSVMLKCRKKDYRPNA